ncbi:hypothetical protein PFISCL1PPCAC_12955, partial [Pristionchus fissidentatus]
FCGWSVNKEIKRGTISVKLRLMHARAMHMLILQTLNPVLFLYGPFIILFVASMVGIDSHVPEKITEIIIHIFPINNVIIILTKTDEY